MIEERIFVGNLRLARLISKVPGAVVECGVWKGGMCAGLAAVLGPEREYWLFDSFEGLPQAQQIDGAAAARWQADTTSKHYHDNCAADDRFARDAMQRAGILDAHFVKGWFSATLPSGFPADKQIALLRLDSDWYESTMQCLRSLFDKVTPGGLIVVDDYFVWEGCSKAVHAFLAENSRPEVIREQEGVAWMRKVR